jgi:hypothetical protein
MGGTQLGNSIVMIGFKIAPLNPATVDLCDEDKLEQVKCNILYL